MKQPLIIIMILLLAVMLTGCQAVLTSPAEGPIGYAEIVMPGGAIISGEYDNVVRVSHGWIKVHINDKWYGMNELRVVLREL